MGIRNQKLGKVKKFQVWVVGREKGKKPYVGVDSNPPGPYRVNTAFYRLGYCTDVLTKLDVDAGVEVPVLDLLGRLTSVW